jgi:hypothetical protein
MRLRRPRARWFFLATGKLSWVAVLLLLLLVLIWGGALSLKPPIATAKNNNPFSAYLSNAEYMVIQVDNRLNPLWDGAEIPRHLPSWNFSSKTVGPSIFDVQHWSNVHGYAYLFFVSPDKLSGPRGEAMSPLWCKVPSLLYALSICHRHHLKAVLFVDSDVGVGKQESRFGIEHVLSQHPAHMFLTPALNSSWLKTIRSNRLQLYPRGGINSGSLIVKCTSEGIELVKAWWFELTAMKSPYELAKVTKRPGTLVRLDALVVDTKHFVKPDKAKINAKMRNLVRMVGPPKHLSMSVHTLTVDETAQPYWKLKIVLSLTMNNESRTVESKIYLDARDKLCEANKQSKLGLRVFNRLLEYGLSAEGVTKADEEDNIEDEDIIEDEDDGKRSMLFSERNVTCATRVPRSTLTDWPGDQDRLNWLFDSAGGARISGKNDDDSPVVLSKQPLIAPCFYTNNSLLFHWCASSNAKASGSRAASERARARFNVPSQTAWEMKLAWQSLAETIPLMRFPQEYTSRQVLGVIDAGRAGEWFLPPKAR